MTAKRGGRQAFRKTLAGRKGTNRLRRVGRGLKRGRYTIRVSAVAADGRTAARTKTLVVGR